MRSRSLRHKHTTSNVLVSEPAQPPTPRLATVTPANKKMTGRNRVHSGNPVAPYIYIYICLFFLFFFKASALSLLFEYLSLPLVFYSFPLFWVVISVLRLWGWRPCTQQPAVLRPSALVLIIQSAVPLCTRIWAPLLCLLFYPPLWKTDAESRMMPSYSKQLFKADCGSIGRINPESKLSHSLSNESTMKQQTNTLFKMYLCFPLFPCGGNHFNPDVLGWLWKPQATTALSLL